MRGRLLGLWVGAIVLGGCQTKAPVVNVAAQPCECACSYRAVAPQIGKGCWVQNDVLVCPLVKRTLEIEPAYPEADPRCEKQEDGSLRCEVEQ
jgi:hypothetical protein